MSEHIAIRKAEHDDLPAIDDINEEFVTNEEKRMFIHGAVREGSVWIAAHNEAPAGYIIAARSFFGIAFIQLLNVHRDHRRKGVAQALIAAVEEWSPTEKIFTSTNESNAPMRALLDRLGYAYSGTVFNLDEGDPERFYFKQLR
jgi:GNAT superfamily N-acetyltransferase